MINPFLSRRGFFARGAMLGAVVTSTALQLPLAIPAAAQDNGDKVSQAEAQYQSAPRKGQKCKDCSYFQPPSSCSMVTGTISPVGWCKFFDAKG